MTTAGRLIARSRFLLLDFDGPVTPLLPSPLNAQAAALAREAWPSQVPIPPEVRNVGDHLEVLRAAYAVGDATGGPVEQACDGAEVQAATTCTLTPGAADLMRSYATTGRPIHVVSNNAPEAIAVALDKHELTDTVASIHGRPKGHPELMKPHPHILLAAMDGHTSPGVMLGDSTTDVEAARVAGVPCIGYVTREDKAHELQHATATTNSLQHLTATSSGVCRSPQPPASPGAVTPTKTATATESTTPS